MCTRPEAIISAACAIAGAILAAISGWPNQKPRMVRGLKMTSNGLSGKAAGRYDHPLPPSEAGQRRQDPVADLDALHPRPYGENPADAFITDDGGKRRAECVDALCDHEVVRVDGGKLDADQDLVRAGSVGLGNVDVLETLDRVAKSGELNSAHIAASF